MTGSQSRFLRFWFFWCFFSSLSLPLPETSLGADATSPTPAAATPHPRRAGPGRTWAGPVPASPAAATKAAAGVLTTALPFSSAEPPRGAGASPGPCAWGAALDMPFSLPAAPPLLGFALLLLAAAGRSLPLRQVSAAEVPAPSAQLARPRCGVVAARAPARLIPPAARLGVPRLFVVEAAPGGCSPPRFSAPAEREGCGRRQLLVVPRVRLEAGLEVKRVTFLGARADARQQNERPRGWCAEAFRASPPAERLWGRVWVLGEGREEAETLLRGRCPRGSGSSPSSPPGNNRLVGNVRQSRCRGKGGAGWCRL